MPCARSGTVLQKLDSLTQSFFLDMFGDPKDSGDRWPARSLRDLLDIPLRNGLSPSHSGAFRGNVLTLAAITGRDFNASHVKEASFHSHPPPDQTVDIRDFLICRGNGNRHLVGKGQFATSTIPDVLFPDTMIAARISPNKIEREFIGHIWNTTGIRAQIERIARTTNGTYKVNQHGLESISVASPPMELQRGFSKQVRTINGIIRFCTTDAVALEAAFASLQHRAFRGEL